MDDVEVSGYWNQNATAWAEQVRRGYDLYREVLNNPAMFELIGPVSGKDVIDLGCGEGYNTRKIAPNARSVCGVDISERMIQYAKEAERKQPLGIRYTVSSFSELSMFQEESFDLAISFMALMDGVDYDGAISEAARVLRPGGTLVFSILHPCFATPGLEWVTDDNGEKSKLLVSHYFGCDPYIDTWSFSKSPIANEFPPFNVPRFQRTLSQYLNPLPANGLCIQYLGEPKPGEVACDEHPFLDKWSRHAALFLHVKAVKATG